jgi:membrane fusion protein, multidrug efflux system
MSVRPRVAASIFILMAAFVFGSCRTAAAQNASTTTGPAPNAPQGIPVTTGHAAVGDVPQYYFGLGTVQALNTVQIKAQVNGTLVALPIQEGQEVKKGDIVAQIDPRPYKAALDQAVAQRQQDMAQLNGAQLDLKRYQDLAKRSFAPIQQVDDQQATVSRFTAAVAVDEALIETARINLDYCVIRAPITGKASFYQVTEGNVIQASNQPNGIITIVQDKPISVVVTLPAANLPVVQQARTVGPVPVTAFDGSSGKELATGTLLTPNNTIDTTTGTISLKATFANDDDHLWPGQFVNSRVQVGTLRQVVSVPELSVQHGPDGTFIYVAKPDNTVAQVPIQVGDSVDGRTVVSKGLSGNETVVVSGQSRLQPGSHIAATTSSKASAS